MIILNYTPWLSGNVVQFSSRATRISHRLKKKKRGERERYEVAPFQIIGRELQSWISFRPEISLESITPAVCLTILLRRCPTSRATYIVAVPRVHCGVHWKGNNLARIFYSIRIVEISTPIYTALLHRPDSRPIIIVRYLSRIRCRSPSFSSKCSN